jgi:hypothetical protein
MGLQRWMAVTAAMLSPAHELTPSRHGSPQECSSPNRLRSNGRFGSFSFIDEISGCSPVQDEASMAVTAEKNSVNGEWSIRENKRRWANSSLFFK